MARRTKGGKQALKALHVTERNIPLEKRLPDQSTGKWIFHLQQERTLQFSIASEQEASSTILIEGHDISTLLDYLYTHRELIYDATHDRDLRLLEAKDPGNDSPATWLEGRQVKRTLYLDNGVQRTRADI
jgi:hypothetical protein